MAHGVYWGAEAVTSGGGITDVWAWVNSSDAGSGGIALAGTLVACLVIAMIVSFRRRSRL